MRYELSGRFITLKFKNIEELQSVNGYHPIEIELYDYEGAKFTYEFDIVFKVPLKQREEIKEPEKHFNSTIEAKIESVTNTGLMKVIFNRTVNT